MGNVCEYCGASLEKVIWKDLVVIKDLLGSMLTDKDGNLVLEPISAEVTLEKENVYDLEPVYALAREKYKDTNWDLLTDLHHAVYFHKADLEKLPYGLEGCGAHCKECDARY